MISGLLVVVVLLLVAVATLTTTTTTTTTTTAAATAPPFATNTSTSASISLTSDLGLQKEPQSGPSKSRKGPIYTNQFVIQVEGGELAARKLASKHGFVYLNHILDDYYHLEHRRLSKRSTSASDEQGFNISDIQDEPQVLQLQRQVLKKRVKRDFLELNKQPPVPPPPQPQRSQLLRPATHPRPAHHQFTRPANQPAQRTQQQQHQLAIASLRMGKLPPIESPAEVVALKSQELLETAGSSASLLYQAKPRPQLLANVTSLPPPPLNSSAAAAAQRVGSQNRPFNDPSWPLMWYLDGGAKNGFDLNVLAAWKMGYTGKGIVITILDDGLEKDHPDLQANYDPLASFDINGDDADPMPRYDANDSNRHGTRCAGEVAAVPDNNICSIGIAYNSKVGGVRMLDGDVTDAVEARSLGLNNQHIHIYSASWGPDDNGKTVDGPGELATRAFMEGVTNGRQGLGSIFVFASGNGGREHDNCNCDGYTNSIWTLSISSATENGYVPWYIEACSSTLATTYSSGSYEERQITTTDLHHSCTSSHTGTSASAPLAAGICALVLESNPRLTWRDMQHIVVRTAKPANLVAKDWRTNALGRNVSHAFGYGLMDAAAMITMAKRWTTVPVQYTCEVRSPQMDQLIRPKGYIELKLRAECANVRFLEHVQSKVTLSAARRGDLHIYLISPHGTRSTLLAQRPNDQAEQGFKNWPFMTVHNWGESPNGNWTLEVHNDGKPQNRAFLKEWTLILYGTYEDPNRHLDSSAGPVPAMSRPLPPHAARPKQTPETPPPPPPPPISSNTNQFPSGELAAPQPAKPNSHWSFTVPPPLLVSTTSKPTTTQMPPTTSTSSSFVTTFKTIVTTSSAGGSRIQVGGAKADFEVVSPPTTTPPQQHEPAPTRVTPLEAGAGSQAVNVSEPPMKPPVVAQPESVGGVGTQNNELDGNQIDLKLSKDYRSSGDQSIYSSAPGANNFESTKLIPSESAAALDKSQTTPPTTTTTTRQQNSALNYNGNKSIPLIALSLLLLIFLQVNYAKQQLVVRVKEFIC